MEQEDLLIHQLADSVGVSIRTIRYYIAEGLLPPPETKGRYATFNEEYRMRLELILKLKNAFLPLKEIRDRIAGLDPQQVRDMLDRLETGTAIQDEQLLDLSPSQKMMVKEKPLGGALDYLATKMNAPRLEVLQPDQVGRNVPPKTSRPQRRQAPAAENWQRIELAPGLEIHVRNAEEAVYRERIRQIVEFAQIQFS